MKKTECIETYADCVTNENGTCVADVQKKGVFSKPYILYCIMTLSVILFTLAFAASELFSLLFSEGYPGQMILSKFFGFYGTDEKSFKEILLETSFADLSFISGKNNASGENTEQTVPDKSPDKIPDSTDKETSATDMPQAYPSTDVTDNIYEYDPSELPEGMHGIIPMDLSLSEYGNEYVNSSSKLDIKCEMLEKYDFSIDTGALFPKGAPLVLIVHTHGSEAYTEENISFYDSTKEVSRSYDTDKNVVAVGRLFARILNDAGIPTIHSEIMHDTKSYSGAYSESGKTVSEYLKKYPSIQYVIDIHRDAVIKSSGELVKAVTLTPNGKSAQLMCVVGTGNDGIFCKNWERNLSLAQKLREKLNTECGTLCRPTCLRDSSYNQQYAPYSLLLEIGAAGNTLSEAELAASYAARALAEIIKE